jgi:hypothetical protein
MKHFELGWGDWVIFIVLMVLILRATRTSWGNKFAPASYAPSTTA